MKVIGSFQECRPRFASWIWMIFKIVSYLTYVGCFFEGECLYPYQNDESIPSRDRWLKKVHFAVKKSFKVSL